MTVAIDTNILLDILLPDPEYGTSSYGLLQKYIRKDRLIISQVVFCELASQFNEENLLECFLKDTGIELIHSTDKALWFAATAWKKYTAARDQSMQCRHCGHKSQYFCPECHEIISCRQHIISDFLIAGHAMAEAGILLTRDRGFYKTYFSSLKCEDGIRAVT